MRLTVLILSILFLSSLLSAQECTQIEPPPMLNLRLGMTVPEVNAVIGRDLKVKIKPDGERSFFKNWIKKETKGTLTGMRAIYLRFFNGRLYQIELFYKEDHRWTDLESMLSDYASDTGFGSEYWEVKNGYANAQCGGFSLEADRVLGAHFQLTDNAVLAAVEESRKKK